MKPSRHSLVIRTSIVALCAAGLLEISVCREMLDAVEARQLPDAAGGRAVALLREIVAQANY